MATNTRKSTASAAKPSVKSGSQPAIERGGDGLAQEPDLEQRIAERAYEIYLRRGGDGGDAVSDWLQAETEIRGPRPAVTEHQDSASRPLEKGRKGKAMKKEMQQLSEASAGGF